MTWFRVSGGEMHGAEINGVVFDDALINNVIELYKDGELIKSTVVTVDKTFKFSGIQKAGMYLISTKDEPSAKKVVNVSYKNVVEKEKVETTLSAFYVQVTFKFQDRDFSGQKVKLYKEDDSYEEFIVSENNKLTVFLNEEGLYKLKFGEFFEYEKRVNVTSEEMRENVEKVITTCPVDPVPWADATDHEMYLMLQAHYEGIINISDYWSVGDIRKISLYPTGPFDVPPRTVGQDVELVIIDFNHDELADGSGFAAVTIQQRDALKESSYMNSSDKNKGGWKECERRRWCNTLYKNALPSFFNAEIKKVIKYTASNSEVVATEDDIFLVSEVEVYGGRDAVNSIEGEGSQYEYFKSASNRRKYSGIEHKSSVIWWERSPTKDTTTRFCSVSQVGTLAYSNASSNYGLAPTFCL